VTKLVNDVAGRSGKAQTEMQTIREGASTMVSHAAEGAADT
jgi:hypothetical protein